ncbi:MAG: hypothetical protein QOF48_1382 [Verrucomicrobiota bacterium]
MHCAAQVNGRGDGPRPTPAGPTNAISMEIQGRWQANTASHPAQFQTDGGAVYLVVSNRMSSALFVDTNLQSKILLLKGRMVPGSGHFELTGNLRSLRDGKIHELYYYCDICSIKGSEPGPCMCCREPVRLVEEAK